MEKECEFYLSNNIIKKIFRIVTNHPDYIFYKAIKIHRKYRNAKMKKQNLRMIIYGRIANKYVNKYGLELYGELGEGLKIRHRNIIINGNAKIGKNVKFHGNNCIGNNGINLETPVIGNNVEIGFGATIIGGIEVADDIIIGANAVVNKSFYEKGVVIAGVPAKVVKKC